MPTLSWIGKEKVLSHHQEVPYKVLEHKYGFREGQEFDEETGSGNLIIHGDNLLALKSLLPKYQGNVKCIYIDVPYNTGNEKWVYNDNVNEPHIKKWLGEVVGTEGEDLSRHDKWLCMMYPRLCLLQKLLKEDGAIFISIDDNEQANLKLICDEIFGQKNYVKTFIWYTQGHTDNQDVITHVHEYILMYAKNIKQLKIRPVVDSNIPADSKILRDFAENSITKNGEKNPPSVFTIPVGFPCEVDSLNLPRQENIDEFMREVGEGTIKRELTAKYRIKYPARLDEMIVENGKLAAPCRVFSGWMNLSKLKKFSNETKCKPFVDSDGSTMSYYISKNGVIYYLREGRTSSYIQSVLENMGTTETNKYMLESMGIVFDYPKPYELISFLLSMVTEGTDIVLDSFAGSGTTAHAVLSLNKDGGKRRFILVEMENYASTITAERVKKVMEGFGEGNKAVKGTGGAFDYYELGEPLFSEDGTLNETIGEDKIREYIYFTETQQDVSKQNPENKYYLGDVFGTAYYLYYEPSNPTTLNHETLRQIVKQRAEQYIIYADTCTLAEEEMQQLSVIFKKIPRDIKRF